MAWPENNIDVISCPAQSCDLNTIENAWRLLELIVYEKRQYNDKDTLWHAILEANNELMTKHSDILINLFDGMDSRLIKVLENNGGEISVPLPKLN